MSMFNDISWGSKDNKKECESSAQPVSLFARRFGAKQWSFLGLGSEKRWYSISEDGPQREWDKMEKMMVTLAESGHPAFPSPEPLVHCPENCFESTKVVENCRLHYCADQETIDTFSHNYFCNSALSLLGSRRNVKK